MNHTIVNGAVETLRDWGQMLRTTTEPQGTSALKTEKGMCCLGIWEDNQDDSWWDETNWLNYESPDFTNASGNGLPDYKRRLPQALTVVGGILDIDSFKSHFEIGDKDNDFVDLFVHLNDQKDFTFEQIADVIDDICNIVDQMTLHS